MIWGLPTSRQAFCCSLSLHSKREAGSGQEFTSSSRVFGSITQRVFYNPERVHFLVLCPPVVLFSTVALDRILLQFAVINIVIHSRSPEFAHTKIQTSLEGDKANMSFLNLLNGPLFPEPGWENTVLEGIPDDLPDPAPVAPVESNFHLPTTRPGFQPAGLGLSGHGSQYLSKLQPGKPFATTLGIYQHHVQQQTPAPPQNTHHLHQRQDTDLPRAQPAPQKTQIQQPAPPPPVPRQTTYIDLTDDDGADAADVYSRLHDLPRNQRLQQQVAFLNHGPNIQQTAQHRVPQQHIPQQYKPQQPPLHPPQRAAPAPRTYSRETPHRLQQQYPNAQAPVPQHRAAPGTFWETQYGYSSQTDSAAVLKPSRSVRPEPMSERRGPSYSIPHSATPSAVPSLWMGPPAQQPQSNHIAPQRMANTHAADRGRSLAQVNTTTEMGPPPRQTGNQNAGSRSLQSDTPTSTPLAPVSTHAQVDSGVSTSSEPGPHGHIEVPRLWIKENGSAQIRSRPSKKRGADTLEGSEDLQPAKQRRGRPPGSLNKAEITKPVQEEEMTSQHPLPGMPHSNPQSEPSLDANKSSAQTEGVVPELPKPQSRMEKHFNRAAVTSATGDPRTSLEGPFSHSELVYIDKYLRKDVPNFLRAIGYRPQSDPVAEGSRKVTEQPTQGYPPVSKTSAAQLTAPPKVSRKRNREGDVETTPQDKPKKKQRHEAAPMPQEEGDYVLLDMQHELEGLPDMGLIAMDSVQYDVLLAIGYGPAFKGNMYAKATESGTEEDDSPDWIVMEDLVPAGWTDRWFE